MNNIKISSKYKFARKLQQGFSFLEVMIVVAILAGLAAIVGPAIFQRLDSAKVDQTKIQIRSIENALELYYLDNGKYPDTADGLSALIEQPSGSSSWNGPYLKGGKVPTDSWKQSFQYSLDTNSFTITSFGNDGQAGGSEAAADITNKE